MGFISLDNTSRSSFCDEETLQSLNEMQLVFYIRVTCLLLFQDSTILVEKETGSICPSMCEIEIGRIIAKKSTNSSNWKFHTGRGD